MGRYLDNEDLGNMRLLLNETVESFLQERRESDGGWAAITLEDVNQLGDIIDFLIELKCEQDPDGDLPIEYRLVNRRVCYFPYFDTMPYSSYSSDDPERGKMLMDSFRAALFNLQVAIEESDKINKAIQYEEYLRHKAREAKDVKPET